MTRRALLAVLLLLILGPARADEESPSAPDRGGLVLAGPAWDDVLAAVGRPGGTIGYGAEAMAAYGGDHLRLRSVLGLFRDVRALPRETGRITDELLQRGQDPAGLVYRAFRLTDVAAGRRLSFERDESPDAPPGVDDAAWGELPERARHLVARLYAAAAAAAPWLERAFPAEGQEAGAARYRRATAPWQDEENDQVATYAKASFEALETTDRAYLAYGAAVLLVRLRDALRAYEEAGEGDEEPEKSEGEESGGPRLVVDTVLGRISVFGAGDDEVELPEGTLLSVDLGGDDAWSGHVGSSRASVRRIGLHVDLGGDDTYESDVPGTVACGLFGLGVVVDLSGEDAYWVEESGLGCAWHGVGLLWDHAGDDVYRTQGAWGQGAAHVGVGALVDLAGDDVYECGEQSQGLGSTLGAGLLVDLAGDDRYVARDDGNVSALYKDQSVAMSQGCGYGRRADLGDGHSLAGGFGVLADGGGDDVYHAQVWAQGAGYWWGVGVLEDRGGDDRYRNGKYSAGAAAHFAIGVCVDLAGNDRHNQGNDTAVNQYQGHARDGSIGVFVDGDGDDAYVFRNHCGGSADLGSIGLFWDRQGEDRYVWLPSDLGAPNGWTDTGPMGTATRYEPFRSFRDDLPSWGIFLDTGGTDAYEARGEHAGIELLAADGGAWIHHPGPLSWGVGFDR